MYIHTWHERKKRERPSGGWDPFRCGPCRRRYLCPGDGATAPGLGKSLNPTSIFPRLPTPQKYTTFNFPKGLPLFDTEFWSLFSSSSIVSAHPLSIDVKPGRLRRGLASRRTKVQGSRAPGREGKILRRGEGESEAFALRDLVDNRGFGTGGFRGVK
ncbi:hypothetical protein F5144DRAFT_160391 [Chaetomium tenue]|uniref:Uncharacterized protein n=1 Tax=Chaetomium tenue TaxID=1854479 RepID=A0ACB7PC63_9PEZI|nr:hypothetical protein F5144DRAFT_160391 [Chaetomium globosum]